MNRTHLVLLLAVLSLGSFYFWSKLNKLNTEQTEYQAKRYFPEKSEADIESLAVSCSDPVFDYVLQRRGEHWYLDGHLASQEKSPQLVNSLIELATEREMEASPSPEDDRMFGLDAPNYIITVTANGGQSLGTVLLGKRAPGGNHFYGKLKSGGAISTVPAYTLSPLEEEPKDLRENSPFPVEIVAVDRFEFSAGSEQATLLRPVGQTEGFRFARPADRDADETRVTELMYLLKDLKVARFLSDSETTDLGQPVVTYRGHEVESKYDLVTEFNQPVAVTPRLRYGRRFMTESGKQEALAGTEERFVIELLSDSKVLAPTRGQFEDRRILKQAVDQITTITLDLANGPLKAKRDGQGGWQVTEPATDQPDGAMSAKLDALLWAVRDLRFQDSQAKIEPSGNHEWSARFGTSEGTSLDLRFGRDKSGKPFVGLRDQNLLLQEDLVPALEDAVKALSAPHTTATATPSL